MLIDSGAIHIQFACDSAHIRSPMVSPGGFNSGWRNLLLLYRPMSALGQKRTNAVQKGMSALPPIATAKADMCGALAHVCFGPEADIDSFN